MTRKNTRGLLASLGAVVTAAALALGGATGANAQQVNTPPTESDVVITKLAQPESLGDPADGTALATPPAQGEGIEGVTFEAYLVEGTEDGGGNDIGTNDGQQYAAGLDSVADVADDLAADPTATGTTDSGGVLSWDGLQRGLYVIQENGTPEGVIAADDFFLSVPLSDPAGNGWLDTIYVYPKNAQVAATKTVENAGAYAVGNDVTWTINTAIPRVPNPGGEADFTATDAFEVHDTLQDNQLAVATNDAGEPAVTVTTPAGLTVGEDYTVDLEDAGESTRVEVVFTATGLDALAAAVNGDADASVTVEIITEVLASEQITNGAEIYVDNAAINGDNPLTVDEPAQVRYGGYLLNKLSSDDSVEDLSGAQFRVYLSQADAEAGGDNYITTTLNTAGLWETTEEGTVLIDGLRYSGWADNQVQTEGDEEGSFQTYWLVETQALPEHQTLAEPISFIVDEDSATQTDEMITNVPTSAAAFELPLTGGMGTAFLTVLGIGVLVAVLLMARRRRANA